MDTRNAVAFLEGGGEMGARMRGETLEDFLAARPVHKGEAVERKG